MSAPFFSRLNTKLLIVITGVLLLSLFAYIYIVVNKLKEDLSVSLAQSAYNISDVIKQSARYSMLHNQREGIYQIIKTIGTEPGIYRVRIYNKYGAIQFSSDSSEIGQSVDINSESCTMCHSKKSLPSNLDWRQMIRNFRTPDDKKMLGLINPIQNDIDCAESDCHAHPREKKLLGVLDVIISTDRFDAAIDTNTRNVVVGSILLIVLIGVLSAFAITIVLNKPLKEVAKGINEIAQGNLTYKIPLKTKDEIGVLASQFNEMSEKLDKAYKEIKEWSENLNTKVEQKNAELKHIYEQIVQIEKLASLGKLSATVAHELNNPLEGILTYSKLVSKMISTNPEEKKDQAVKYLGLISDETARCGRIVKDLLLFSQQGESIMGDYNINDIIEKALSLIQHHIDIHHIVLVKDFHAQQSYVRCDTHKIEQALLSILMNAIEAMQEGNRLEVSTLVNGKMVEIRIKDEGRGISEKDLPNIFEPFFTTKREIKGTGLGLSVAYGIITQHKGSIQVEETSIRGTTFLVSLPVII